MAFALLTIAAAILAVSNAADSAVDVNRLFHSQIDRQDPPPPPQLPQLPSISHSTGPQRQPAVPQRNPNIPPFEPQSTPRAPTEQSTAPLTGGIDDADYVDDFVPYKNARHDEFDWALTKSVLLNNGNNTILSPFLVKLLMSILAEAAGTETSTARELASVWPTIRSFFDTREYYGKVFKSLLNKNPDYDLNLGVKAYVDNFIEPRQRFQAIAKSFYSADIERLDFSQTRESTEVINNWCRNITHDFIKEIVTEADVEKAVILLLNAVYFNGFWKRPFSENQTQTMAFKTDKRNDAPSQFMDITADFYYMESKQLDAKIIRLPYKGKKFSMYVVLPNEVEGLNELIGKVDSSTLHRAQWLMDELEVRVLLPKFKFDNEVHLNQVLKDLGIKAMFTNQASFPLLVRGAAVQDRLQVSNVLQKTGINVNEKGSTVYAATQISLSNKFGGDIEFRADHPFLFLIEDETTGTLLFSGIVNKPEY